jgi:hypothetical protein
VDQVLGFLEKVQNEEVQKVSREVIQGPELMQQDFTQELERNGDEATSIFVFEKIYDFQMKKYAKLVNSLEHKNYVIYLLDLLEFKIIPNDVVIQQLLFLKGTFSVLLT